MINKISKPKMAMIFAAGRGDRMRPLSDVCPKPLLSVADKPFIIWHIEALAAAGFTNIVINHAWLGEKIEKMVGDGKEWGVEIDYSSEVVGKETAGGIAFARHLLAKNGNRFFAGIAADIFTDYDYRKLLVTIDQMEHASHIRSTEQNVMHLVMVSNPDFHPQGDFYLANNQLSLSSNQNAQRLTFACIGVYDLHVFNDIDAGQTVSLSSIFKHEIKKGRVSGEFFDGQWDNIGTTKQLYALNNQLGAQFDKSDFSVAKK